MSYLYYLDIVKLNLDCSKTKDNIGTLLLFLSWNIGINLLFMYMELMFLNVIYFQRLSYDELFTTKCYFVLYHWIISLFYMLTCGAENAHFHSLWGVHDFTHPLYTLLNLSVLCLMTLVCLAGLVLLLFELFY